MKQIDFSQAKVLRADFNEWSQKEARIKERAQTIKSLVNEKRKLAELRNAGMIDGSITDSEYNDLVRRAAEINIQIEDLKHLNIQNSITEFDRNIDGFKRYQTALDELRKIVDSECLSDKEKFEQYIDLVIVDIKKSVESLFAAIKLGFCLYDRSSLFGEYAFIAGFDLHVAGGESAKEIAKAVSKKIEEALLSVDPVLSDHFEKGFIDFVYGNNTGHLNLDVIGTPARREMAKRDQEIKKVAAQKYFEKNF